MFLGRAGGAPGSAARRGGGLARSSRTARGRVSAPRPGFSRASARCPPHSPRYQRLTWREAALALVIGSLGSACLRMRGNREDPAGPVGVRTGGHVGQLVDVLDSHVHAAVEELARGVVTEPAGWPVAGPRVAGEIVERRRPCLSDVD